MVILAFVLSLWGIFEKATIAGTNNSNMMSEKTTQNIVYSLVEKEDHNTCILKYSIYSSESLETDYFTNR